MFHLFYVSDTIFSLQSSLKNRLLTQLIFGGMEQLLVFIYYNDNLIYENFKNDWKTNSKCMIVEIFFIHFWLIFRICLFYFSYMQ